MTESAPLRDVIADARPGFACGEIDPNGVVQIRMNNVSSDGALVMDSLRRVPRDAADLSRFEVGTGDVLFNATNSPELVGKSALFGGYPEHVVYSNHFIRLRPVVSRLDSGYLSRWLHMLWRRGEFFRMCRQWVNQASVASDRLLSLEIPLPPLPEQRRIAAILDKADDLRAKRRAALERLNGLTQAMFLEMFGDPVLNRKGWETRTLKDVGTVDRGVSKHRPRNAPELLGGPYPFVQTGDVANCDGYIREYHSTYSEVGLRQSKMWVAGTLCITIAANIAKTGILTFNACFPDSVVGFRAEDPATVVYVRTWLSFLQSRLEDAAPESAQKNINLAVLRDLALPVPPLHLQRVFAERVKRIEEVRLATHDSATAFGALFTSLQQQAFAGAL